MKILLNFAHASEATKANFHENKKIIYRSPFLKEVYGLHSLKFTGSLVTGIPCLQAISKSNSLLLFHNTLTNSMLDCYTY